MNRPPSHITLELEERDVQEDLAKIVNSMSRIRAETMADRKISDEKKDEYLHLAYRLASAIEGVADESMTKKMQKVVRTIDKNSALLDYDPRQDPYWNQKCNGFAQALDDLLISVVKEDFHTIDAKHHVLQAVKYLGAADEQFEEKERIYNTILPFHGGVALDSGNGLCNKIMGALFGAKYNVKRIDNLTLKLDGDLALAGHLLSKLTDMGYTRAEMIMLKTEFEKFHMKFARSEIIENGSEIDNPNEDKKVKGLANIVGNMIKYTIPLSYPIIGGLPRYFRNRLNKFTESAGYNFKNIRQELSNFGVELAGGIGLGVAGGLMDNDFMLVGGVYFGLQAVGRSIIGDIKDNLCCGLHAKLPLLPLELYLRKHDQSIRDDNVIVSVKLGDSTVPEEIPNPTGFYDAVSQLNIPEEIEHNITWSNENHHAFGKRFIEYVAEHANQKIPEALDIDIGVDKKNQAVVYNHNLRIGDYIKDCSLFCFEGRRYAVTAITRDAGDNNINGKIADIISSNIGERDKVEKIGKDLDLKYINIKLFEKTQLKQEYEATQ